MKHCMHPSSSSTGMKNTIHVIMLLAVQTMFRTTKVSSFTTISIGRSLMVHHHGNKKYHPTRTQFHHNHAQHEHAVNRKQHRSFTATSTTLKSQQQSYTNKILDILDHEPIITSTKSKTVKLYQAVSTKAKKRNEMQMTILEGHRLVIDTLAHKSSRDLYHDVLVSYDALNHPKLGEELSKQLGDLMAMNRNCRVRLAEQNVINAACDTVTPQGVVALIGIPKPYTYSQSTTETKREMKNKFYLILDGISDPGNVGTLIRSAKATGVEAIILLPNCCDVFNPKAVRSAMGTTFHVPICSFSSWDECFNVMTTEFGALGEDIFAATMEGSENSGDKTQSFESIPHYDINWYESNSSGKALIIGKEVRFRIFSFL